MFNLALLHDAVAAANPDRVCLRWRGNGWTWSEISVRSARFAGALHHAGLGCRRERLGLHGWERGQDTVALVLRNSNVYLEAMLGSYKARCAPGNVNYRYTCEEMAYVLNDMGAAAVVYEADLAPVVWQTLGHLERTPILFEVGGSYDSALEDADPFIDPNCSPDDLYVLYTGGTTGKPKGVLWRQGDFITGALGVRASSVEEIAERSRRGTALRVLPTAPFMHGAAHWNAWSAWLSGGTIVIQHHVDRLDADDVWDTVASERVSSLQLVGDAFALPLLDSLERRPIRPDTVRFVMSGGVTLSAANKARFCALLPGVKVVDIVGSSESGRQGMHTSEAGNVSSGRFNPSAGSTVLNEARDIELDPGSDDIGWLATSGAVPLGYLGDPVRTDETFPTLGSRRFSVPGDRARRLADGSIELLGRESASINTGGEKVFVEEVEDALKRHPSVIDAMVVGLPDQRWGQQVAAVVAMCDETTDDELLTEAGQHLARYKLPRLIVRRPALQRSPSGKPDYAWARREAALGS